MKRELIEPWEWEHQTVRKRCMEWARVNPGTVWMREMRAFQFQVKKIPDCFGSQPYFKIWARPVATRQKDDTWNAVGNEATILKAQRAAEVYCETN